MTRLVEMDDLHVTFETPTGPVRAVRGLSLEIEQGEILGVVGESGCGKSVTFRALLGLTPGSATVTGTARFAGRPARTDGELCADTSMIYQNPGAALNPVFTIGRQLRLAAGSDDQDRLVELLADVGLPDPERAMDAYPHEFSGGMQQRAVIAFALAQSPRLLIADEPTTALDVTTQAQVLDLIKRLRTKRDLSVVLISHDLGVIARICDRVAVLYAGRVIEVGETHQVLNDPLHPYTQALLASIPGGTAVGRTLAAIAGSVPDGREEIPGCAYAPRCRRATDICRTEAPAMKRPTGTVDSPSVTDGHTAACVLVGSAASDPGVAIGPDA